ncbi:sporulation protein [Methanomicrobium antiquum]|uniref:Sporulation protein n=1 Tax=Methanomicrobium antiquum TaxID=487686 RepID=A0AAF0FR73_9EURY|nr:spore germination protein GerW family protein [Methanomicrobium antiquum]WFN36351.1 sporulation protein [Methanomicrobium antiquum]
MEKNDMFVKTLEELDRLLNADSILGDAVDLGDHVIIPVASFAFGYGAGYGEGEDNGGGTGAGAGISPVAVVLIDKTLHGEGAVKVVPLRKPGAISEAISAVGSDLLPKVVEALKLELDKKDDEKEKNKDLKDKKTETKKE